MNPATHSPAAVRGSVSRRRLSILRCSQVFFLIIGVLALGYYAYAMLEAKVYQVYQARQFQRAQQIRSAEKLQQPQQSQKTVEDLRAGNASVESTANLPAVGLLADDSETDLEQPAGESASERPSSTASTSAAKTSGPAADFPLGRIEIHRIGLEAMIMEGLGEKTLRHAVGHIPGTPAPGQAGNVGLAAHRDTFFRPLRNIRKGDEIILTTLDRVSRYRVDLLSVVEPENVDVLKDTPDAILTLVTCYPFNFIGPAPRRFIVRARKITE